MFLFELCTALIDIVLESVADTGRLAAAAVLFIAVQFHFVAHQPSCGGLRCLEQRNASSGSRWPLSCFRNLWPQYHLDTAARQSADLNVVDGSETPTLAALLLTELDSCCIVGTPGCLSAAAVRLARAAPLLHRRMEYGPSLRLLALLHVRVHGYAWLGFHSVCFSWALTTGLLGHRVVHPDRWGCGAVPVACA
jgi:hypothetical protein